MHLSKILQLLPLALTCSIVSAVPVPDDAAQADAASPDRRRQAPPPKAVGRLFSIDNKLQYFSGVNAWWLGHLFYQSDVDQAFSQISASGFKTARIWAFGNTNNAATETNIFYQTLNSSGAFINYDVNKGIGRLDYAVQKAASLNIKLIMVLLNNFNDLGGINTYNVAFGGTATSFFTDAQSQAAYQSYIKFIVNRYKDSGAIFSWELCNEPRCANCPTSTITNWATKTSQYIKSLDRIHMVSVGDEGWLTPSFQGSDGSYPYQGTIGVDAVALLNIPTIDYGTFHLYPSYYGEPYTWGSTWVQQHSAIGKAANKPVVLEEYGYPDAATRAQYYPQLYNTIVNQSSIASDMVWQFGSNFAGENPFDNFAMYYSTDPASEYQALVITEKNAMAAKFPRAGNN